MEKGTYQLLSDNGDWSVLFYNARTNVAHKLVTFHQAGWGNDARRMASAYIADREKFITDESKLSLRLSSLKGA